MIMLFSFIKYYILTCANGHMFIIVTFVVNNLS